MYSLNPNSLQDLKVNNTPENAPRGPYKWMLDGFAASAGIAGRREISHVDVPAMMNYTPNTPQPRVSPLAGVNNQTAPVSKMPSKFPLMDILNGGLTTLDSMIPNDPVRRPVVNPLLSYNEHAYGTGSEALAADGIHINPAHKGVFTGKAKAHGEGVQAFASKVLANKSDYSSSTVKQANFAKNASKWHKADDGVTLQDPITIVDPNAPPSAQSKSQQASTMAASWIPMAQQLVKLRNQYEMAYNLTYNAGKEEGWNSKKLQAALLKATGPLQQQIQQLQGQLPKHYDDGGTVTKRKADDGASIDPGGDPIVDKYGKYVEGRQGWLKWVDNKLGGSTIRDMTMSAAKFSHLNPALLYSSAMEEGMNQRIKNPDYVSGAYDNSYAKNKKLKDYPVDGFYNYGLDTFGSEYKSLQKKGYLPDGFEKNFTPFEGLNEKNQKVTTAAFRDDSSAMQAKAAMIAEKRDDIAGYAKKKGYDLSPEANDFFTLAAYNGGMGNGEKMLDYFQNQGLLKDNAFLKQRPKQYAGIYDNVMHRIQGAQMMRGEHIFEMGGAIPGMEGNTYGILGASDKDITGSRSRKGKRAASGASLPLYLQQGETHDLSAQDIQHLISQGYELKYL